MRSTVLGLLVAGVGLVGCAHQSSDPFSPSAPLAPDAGPVSAATLAVDPAPAPAAARPENRDGRWLSATTESDFMLTGRTAQAIGVFIDVPQGASPGHVPTALTLAIDTSGSMRGDSIVHAREAARRLVEQLADGDRLSIVTFADRARVRMDPVILDARSRSTALAVLEELSADGGTAMFDGLKLAESQMWGTPESHLVRRMVVISDGKATEGPTSPEDLGRIAEVGLQRGIQVTSVGVGLDYDEAILNELAIRSSGRLYHVEHSQQLSGIIEQEVALLEATAAAEVEVELVAAPGVRLLGTDVARTRWDGDRLMVPIGAVFEGQQRELLVRAVVDEAEVGSKVLASVRMHFRDPAEDGLRRVQETVLRATVTDDPSLVAAHANSRTQTLMAMREASAIAQLASNRASAGDLEQAEAELVRAERQLQAQAARASNQVDRDRATRSAEKMASSRRQISKAKRKPASARAHDSRQMALELNDAAMADKGF